MSHPVCTVSWLIVEALIATVVLDSVKVVKESRGHWFGRLPLYSWHCTRRTTHGCHGDGGDARTPKRRLCNHRLSSKYIQNILGLCWLNVHDVNLIVYYVWITSTVKSNCLVSLIIDLLKIGTLTVNLFQLTEDFISFLYKDDSYSK